MKYPFNEGDTYYTFDEKNKLIESCWDDQSEVLYSKNKKYFTATPITSDEFSDLCDLGEEDLCDIPTRYYEDKWGVCYEYGYVVKCGGHTLVLCVYAEVNTDGYEFRPSEHNYSILTPKN